MRAEDWFAVAVRVFGVVTIVNGLSLLLDFLLAKLGYFNQPDPTPGYYLIFGAALIVVGLYLARGAPFLIDFAFPFEDYEEEEDEEPVTNE